MEEIPGSWKTILKQYGYKATYIEGDSLQPNYSFDFNLTFQQKKGNLAFSWRNTIHDYEQEHKFKWHSKDDPRRLIGNIYNGRTELLLELPAQKNKLKIFNTGKIINWLSRLHPNQTATGHTDFDETFITIAKPTTIVPGLMPHLRFLLHPSLGGSLTLDTDWQDAVTARFHLRVQINRLLLTEGDIDYLLESASNLSSVLTC